MTTKSDPGYDSRYGSDDDSSPPRSHSPANFDPGPPRISVNTRSMFRSAAHFDGAGDDFRVFAENHQPLIDYKPLVDGKPDDSWKEFEPPYTKATQVFVDCASGLAKAVGQLGKSLRQFAGYCVATEDNAEYVGKNALNMNGAPDPAGVPGPTREGYQPLTPMRSGKPGAAEPFSGELPSDPSGDPVSGRRL
ncbi:hypothetical protein ACWEV3_33825 [Saccharopolyspora sp. NPDC003752]